MRGADSDGHLVPLVISQAVGEHLSVGLLAFGTIVKAHLAALATALQLQEPAKQKRLLFTYLVLRSMLHYSLITLTESLFLFKNLHASSECLN